MNRHAARFQRLRDRLAAGDGERRECAYCTAPFTAHPQIRTTYCSKRCHFASRSVGRFCSVPWASCAVCERRFVGRGNVVTCSVACREERARTYNYYIPAPPRSFACAGCGVTFTKRGNGAPKYCSRSCAYASPEYREAHANHKARRRVRLRGNGVVSFNRRDIFERDGWRCQLCGDKVDAALAGGHPMGASIDHIVPVAAGGAHEPSNVQLAHLQCNTRRGTRGTVQLRWAA